MITAPRTTNYTPSYLRQEARSLAASHGGGACGKCGARWSLLKAGLHWSIELGRHFDGARLVVVTTCTGREEHPLTITEAL